MARLIIPDWQGSVADHWQRSWLDIDADSRVVEPCRAAGTPDLEEWLTRLEREIRRSPRVTLVAHGVGAILVAHYAVRRSPARIDGALLVAPTDVELVDGDDPRAAFAPMPLHRLPFAALLVASRNDPFLAFGRAQQLAAAWGAPLIDAGLAGHLDAESGHRRWGEGFRLLSALDTGDGAIAA